MGVRHVDENNLSHHFLEEVAHTQGPLGSQGSGGGDSTTSQGTLRMSLKLWGLLSAKSPQGPAQVCAP